MREQPISPNRHRNRNKIYQPEKSSWWIVKWFLKNVIWKLTQLIYLLIKLDYVRNWYEALLIRPKPETPQHYVTSNILNHCFLWYLSFPENRCSDYTNHYWINAFSHIIHIYCKKKNRVSLFHACGANFSQTLTYSRTMHYNIDIKSYITHRCFRIKLKIDIKVGVPLELILYSTKEICLK